MIDLRRWVRDAAVTRAFYASVVYAAVVTVYAAEAIQPPVGKAIGGVIASAVILFIAHGFAEVVPRVVHAGRLTGPDVRAVGRSEAPLLVVAVVPLAPLVMAALDVVPDSTAFLWSILVTLGALFVIAIALCRRDGLSWWRSVLAGGTILAVTSMVVVLEASITH